MSGIAPPLGLPTSVEEPCFPRRVLAVRLTAFAESMKFNFIRFLLAKTGITLTWHPLLEEKVRYKL